MLSLLQRIVAKVPFVNTFLCSSVPKPAENLAFLYHYRQRNTTVPSQPVITIKQDIADRISPSNQARPPQPEYIPEPVYQPQYPPQTIQPEPAPVYQADATPAAPIDWVAVGLGLFAVLAWGGLIPFGLMIYLSYFPPN